MRHPALAISSRFTIHDQTGYLPSDWCLGPKIVDVVLGTRDFEVKLRTMAFLDML